MIIKHLSIGEILANIDTSVRHYVALVVYGGIYVRVHLDHGFVFATVCDRVETRFKSILQDKWAAKRSLC